MDKKKQFIYLLSLGLIAVATSTIFLFPKFISTKYVSPSIHSTVETLSVFSMIFLSLVLIYQFSKDQFLWRFYVAVGLSGMGVLYGFHSISNPGNQFIYSYLLAALGGSFWLAIAGTDRKSANIRKLIWLYGGHIVILMLTGIGILVFSKSLPEMQTNGAHNSMAITIGLLSSVFYLMASFRFYTLFIRRDKFDFYFLSLSTLLFAIASLTVMFSDIWSPEWWFWHFIRLISVVVLSSLIFAEYVRSVEDLLHSRRKIQQNQDYFRLLIDSTAEGIYGMDTNGDCTFCNRSGLNMLGYADENELLGRNMHELIHYKYQDGTSYPEKECKIYKAFQTGCGSHVNDEVLWRKNGTYFQSEYWSYPVSEDNKIVGSVVTFLDVSERYAMNNKYQTIIKTSLDGFWIVNKEGKLIDVNDSYCHMTGYSRNELLKMSISDIEVIENEEDIARHIRKIMSTGSDYFETKHRHKNGDIIDVEISVTSNQKNDGEMFVFIRDITKRKEADQKITENQKKFQELIERSNDGIYVLQNNQFVFINPMFTKILGYEISDISGPDFNLEQIMPEEGIKVIRERMRKMNMGEKLSSRYGFKCYTKAGDIVDINVSIGDIEWEGKPAIMGIIRDESERIRYQNELVEALKKSEESQRLKSLFLSNISHELRTPLNAIVGFSDLIRHETHHLLDESMLDFFDVIEQSSNRLMNTVQNILNISLLETGEIDYIPKEVDLVDIVNRSVKMVELDAQRKNIELIYENRTESVPMTADENLLFNALTNLIDNAIKYTEHGYVSISLQKNCEFVEMAISDSGVGMSDEYLTKLFDTFSQESQGFNKKYQGIGLGLAIAKRTFDLHNIDVTVESKKGTGTTFTLKFLLTSSEKGAQA